MAVWYNSSWQHRQRVSIDHTQVDTPLTNYILYLNQTGFSKSGADNDLFDNARVDGRDIVVTSSDGVTKLPIDLVSYDSVARTMELHVKVPSVSSSFDTEIYLYYGNPTYTETPSVSIWSNYQYVSHDGGLTNAITGTSAVLYGSPAIVSGAIGLGSSTPAAGDIIDSALTRINFPMSFQVIIKPTSIADSNILGMWNYTTNDFFLYRYANQWVFEVEAAGGAQNFGTTNINEWNYLSTTVNSTSYKVYHDGEFFNEIGSNLTESAIETGRSLKFNDIGSFDNSAGSYMFDEIRIANIILSDAYIKAEYVNFSSPVAFYSVSAEEEVTGVYLDVNLAQQTDEALLPEVYVGVNVIADSAPSYSTQWFTGYPGAGVNLLMDAGSMALVGSITSVTAEEQSIGLNIVIDPSKSLAGGTRFKPTKRFELFKEDRFATNKDSQFISGIIKENIDVGGVVCYVWLVTGTFEQKDKSGKTITQLNEGIGDSEDGIMNIFGIQDNILGENRDRSYADDAIRLKGTLAVSQNELDFARFGIMLNNDILQVEFHKENMETQCGRRLIPGDVVEFPHLREIGLGNSVVNRFYQVESITKAPNGYDFSYNYHILAATMRPVVDAQEFIDLMERKDEYGQTLQSQVSDRERSEELTAHLQQAATEQAYQTGWDITPLFISDEGNVFSHRYAGNGLPPNGKPVDMLSYFPASPDEGDYVCRVDNFPNRLYRYQAGKWLLKEVDRKRDWQPYNWTSKLREFSTDRSMSDDMRPWEYKSVHDIMTPRQGRSNPSPKGHEIKVLELFDWEREIKVDIPEIAVADPVVRHVTLAPASSYTVVSPLLNATMGEYNFYLIYYVLKQGADQVTGELLISDDGNNVSMDHEWNNLGDIDYEFFVINEGGVRKLKYTLAGNDTVEMSYFVEAKWAV